MRIKRALKKAKKTKKDKKAKKTKRDKKEKKTKKVVQDAVVAGNDVDFFSMITDLLCTDEGLIKVPAGAKYTVEDVTAVITYAATTTANSLEAAVRELNRKMPDAAIPSADTIFSYIYKENRIDELLSYFRRINSEMLALTGIPDEPVDVAVDFHDCGYYGDRNDNGVRGIKAKKGTSWGHSFFTIDMLLNPKLTLDIVKRTALSKDYAILLEGVITRVRKMGLNVGTMFLDREFYLVAIPNPNYAKDKNNGEFFLFATSTNFGPIEAFIERVPEEYRRRWQIETGYRVKNEFKIRTCSKESVARVLFFVVQCIMHKFLSVQKSILSTAAHELKSLIAEDIQKYLYGGKSSNTLSLAAFYTKIAAYNEHRLVELRRQLAVT